MEKSKKMRTTIEHYKKLEQEGRQSSSSIMELQTQLQYPPTLIPSQNQKKLTDLSALYKDSTYNQTLLSKQFKEYKKEMTSTLYEVTQQRNAFRQKIEELGQDPNEAEISYGRNSAQPMFGKTASQQRRVSNLQHTRKRPTSRPGQVRQQPFIQPQTEQEENPQLENPQQAEQPTPRDRKIKILNVDSEDIMDTAYNVKLNLLSTYTELS